MLSMEQLVRANRFKLVLIAVMLIWVLLRRGGWL